MEVRVWLLAALLWSLPVSAQVSVQVVPLGEVLVDLERRAPAEVVPLNDSLIASEINSVVTAVAVDVGAAVQRGALLVALDAEDFRLQLAAAEARLASAVARHAEAEAKLERARRLGASQYVSEDELLSRETALAVGVADISGARAQVDVARRNLDKTRILAPFDGVVERRLAQVGAYVTVGSPLLRLVETARVELDAEVPVEAAADLERHAVLTFQSQGERWAVRLLRLSPVVSRERRSRRARFAFEEAAPAPGRSGELAWRVASSRLPANLVSRRDGRLGVFLHEDGRAVFHPLPGAEEGRPVAIDLPQDREVIVQGQHRLQDGDPIRLR